MCKDVNEKRILINGEETDYIITKEGRVFSLKDGERKEMKPHIFKDHSSNVVVNITINGKGRKIGLARTVYTHFIGEIPKGRQIYHKDKNKENNHVDNLYIKEPFLSDELVEEICKRFQSGYTRAEVTNWIRDKRLVNSTSYRDIYSYVKAVYNRRTRGFITKNYVWFKEGRM